MTLHTSLDAYLELCELRSGEARLLAMRCVGEEETSGLRRRFSFRFAETSQLLSDDWIET